MIEIGKKEREKTFKENDFENSKLDPRYGYTEEYAYSIKS